MADWLAYGLEDALADTPEIGVVRKHRTGSGLIRYDLRNESLDWAQGGARAARGGKAELHRHDDRAERSPAVPRPCKRRRAAATPQAGEAAAPPNRTRKIPSSRRSRRRRVRAASRARPAIFEFHTEQMGRALRQAHRRHHRGAQERGVPVFWVGLPSIRGPKSTSETQLSQRTVPHPRREGRHHLRRRVGWLRRRQRPLHAARARLRRPDPPAARRRRRAFHQGRRAQARALSRARDPPRGAVQPMPVALPGAEPQPQTPSARPGGRRRARSPARRCRSPLYARPGEELIGDSVQPRRRARPSSPPTCW